ncbi:MAG TPA: EAL domain-containing protein [Gammaproteobacteria bacterium]|nr:EAL domain-containing protein [Gammaproteobacteria bacterium]
MARQLELSGVAEGVETRARLAFLRENGCDVAQGFLLGRPVSAAEARAIWLADEAAATARG